MKITFIIHAIIRSGGTRAIWEHANHLAAFGHEVVIVEVQRPKPSLWFRATHRVARVRFYAVHPRFVLQRFREMRAPSMRWVRLKGAKLRSVPSLGEKWIPDADVVIATTWQSAPWVAAYSDRKGRKVYFVQHYEAIFNESNKDEADATYTLPLRKVVVSTWLKNLINERFNEPAYGPVINGVDFQQFFYTGANGCRANRVGMMYSPVGWKGAADGFRAFAMARERHQDIRLVMFASHAPQGLDHGNMEFHVNPPQHKLRDVYSSCGMWICPSWAEGGAMPPQEAMACKCAVATTDVGAVRDFAIPGETALVSPPRQPEKLAENLIRLLDDAALRDRIAEAAYQKIKEFTWERAARQFEKILLETP